MSLRYAERKEQLPKKRKRENISLHMTELRPNEALFMTSDMTLDCFAVIEHRDISDTGSNKPGRELKETALASRNDNVNSQKSLTARGV